jgi:hypothetical protein
MKKIMIILYLLLILFPGIMLLSMQSQSEPGQQDKRLQPYIDTLRLEGKEPLQFVLTKLQSHDLIIFDDAWHPAVEPFDFYCKLINNRDFQKTIHYIFIEVFSISQQHHIDSYLDSVPEDRSLLYPVFQEDLGGTGWPLKSYIDLMHTIYKVNQTLTKERRLKIIAVNAPTYWPIIKTFKDVELYRKTLVGNDYTMYKTILKEMDGFGSGRKGIFLTNTRHAYKGIKDRQGKYFMNCGTFFYNRHPAKTYSIRFHNLALLIKKKRNLKPGEILSTAGMERIVFKWVRMEKGLWDSAFDFLGNRPVAFPLKDNVFGNADYVGNHVHIAAPGQTMYNANDAIIFLAPLDKLHNSAIVDVIYTSKFKKELVRRYRFLYTNAQLKRKMKQWKVTSLPALIEKEFKAKPEKLIPQAAGLSAMDAWKK